jgi:hypothetical protein
MPKIKRLSIKELKLHKIKVDPQFERWVKRFFADIIKRHYLEPDLNKMMLEVYVLGFHHCMLAQAATKPNN